MKTYQDLSTQQQRMIDLCLSGKNVLVDACIGSGKTTTIQVLCNELRGRSVLYLTYNKLLKDDAKIKIRNSWVNVLNYHGFAFRELASIDVRVAREELIEAYLKFRPRLTKSYDVLIIDEYQDIDNEISEMLNLIKERFPGIQIVAVGDMSQKIYDKSSLDSYAFINEFLGDHESVTFSKCFRISSDLASALGMAWNKEINGVNNKCNVRTMKIDQVADYLATKQPSDILCLGNRKGDMTTVLNQLELDYPWKFNKGTVYATIKDDGNKGNVSVANNAAIFTTYDGSKGLERNVCVLFNFTNDNWGIRSNVPNVKYDILRNIFCVAASRGKEEIVFVYKDSPNDLLALSVLMHETEESINYTRPFNISEAFSFKFKEDVDECFSLLETTEIARDDLSEIKVKSNDEMIDLSPCIGNFQEAVFFGNYNVDEAIAHSKDIHRSMVMSEQLEDDASIEEKILYLTAFDTGQDRYYKQVKTPFIGEHEAELIKDRLFTEFDSREIVQKDCSIEVENAIAGTVLTLQGRIDVLKNGIIYELKFVDSLSHENFLQLACYLVALNIDKGILWNVRTNQMFEVRVPDKKKFLSKVIFTITKRCVFPSENMLQLSSDNKDPILPEDNSHKPYGEDAVPIVVHSSPLDVNNQTNYSRVRKAKPKHCTKKRRHKKKIRIRNTKHSNKRKHKKR